ncbi:hypothetical protein SeLEV6574_g04790 [Synchytrium endobioticum]|uniref:Uncharacterized protein n=1 Tax=Synchytrium endobioticum TaxID=286115 RepID=A0A507CY04_9FUNG|nr:hypothetical protein SeLEV6574_g04798 [Synchytrium endobioticum]TPX43935.1 hypothetical protein SeLEV6574_g04790 [Synchytrium endobioticum]
MDLKWCAGRVSGKSGSRRERESGKVKRPGPIGQQQDASAPRLSCLKFNGFNEKAREITSRYYSLYEGVWSNDTPTWRGNYVRSCIAYLTSNAKLPSTTSNCGLSVALAQAEHIQGRATTIEDMRNRFWYIFRSDGKPAMEPDTSDTVPWTNHANCTYPLCCLVKLPI